MQAWLDESRLALSSSPEEFGVFVDMRHLIPLDHETRLIMLEGQKLYRKSGMARSAVILNNPVLTMQFKQIAHESDIYKYERYLDASHESDWEKQGLDWLKHEIEPESSWAFGSGAIKIR